MTSTSLTPVWYSSKPGRLLARLLGAVGLAAGLAACSTNPTNIGVGLPSVDANSGVYLLDTLTVRASTVLRDSVVSSASSYLLVGRTTDPQLGTLKAISYYEPQLNGTFTPQSNYVLDSVALRLATDNASYRYGDTTGVQSLVRVYPLLKQLPATGPLFASPSITDLSAYIGPSPTLLNRGGVVPQRRASPRLVYIRLPLNRSVGEPLMAAGKANQLRTQDQLTAILPGLIIAPDDQDNNALVRLLANSAESGLILYYHDPVEPAEVLSYTFTQTGRHVFQVTADRTTGALRNLPTRSLQKVDASLTGQQTVIEGSIGLQTRLEFPYLSDLRDLGRNLVITSADLQLEVPPTTLTPFLPTPPSLNVTTSNINNQPVGVYQSGLSYVTGTSALTGQDQGSYTLPMTSYVQAVLSGVVPNNGFLLSSATPELPTRVLLGGPRHPTNRLRLRLYLVNTN